ncbi:MAG: hypothetical protein GF398_13080 [Chitinivibrionales bacterium]|nr:hypothetical protein [Chitinivibrionales bacterium]
MGDSAAEALLLAEFGAKYIPWLFLANALLLFVFSSVIMKVIDRVDRGMLFIGFTCGHAVMLLLIRLAVLWDFSLLYLPLYSYAYVTKILQFLLFWTLANDLVDSRNAGKDFPFIAAGGTLGALAVSFSIPAVLRIISAENLLPFWAMLLFVQGALLIPIRQSFRKSFMPVADNRRPSGGLLAIVQDTGLFKSEPLLSNMAVLYFLLFVILCNQHFAFYRELNSYFAESADQAAEIARFLGYFNGISMLATALIQMSFAGAVIKKIGSTKSMFLLPMMLVLIFGSLSWLSLQDDLAHLLFWGVTVGVGMRIAFFDSFFSPNFQIFFSSLPQSIRGRGKLLIEGFVKPIAMISAGLWLVFVAPRLPFQVNVIGLLGLSLAMVVQTFRLRSKYTENLTRHLKGIDIHSNEWIKNLSRMPQEKGLLDVLEGMITHEQAGISDYAIEILANINSSESLDILKSVIPRVDEHIRAKIISALSRLSRQDLAPVFLECLTDTSDRVVANCIEALFVCNYRYAHDTVLRYLDHDNNRIRANAAVMLWKKADDALQKKIRSILLAMLDSTARYCPASGIFALGEIRMADYLDLLHEFGQKHGALLLSNRSAWRQFIAAVGKDVSDRALKMLLDLCETANSKRLADLSSAVRNMSCKGYRCQKLLEHMAQAGATARSVIARALVELHFNPDKGAGRFLQKIALEETVAAYKDWASIHTIILNGSGNEALLLRHAIVEECILRRITTLLYSAALLDSGKQIEKVIHRLQHKNKHIRARALEVLDNTGDAKVNSWVLRLLESEDAAVHSNYGRDAFSLKPKALNDIILEYRHSDRSWVRRIALAATEVC